MKIPIQTTAEIDEQSLKLANLLQTKNPGNISQLLESSPEDAVLVPLLLNHLDDLLARNEDTPLTLVMLRATVEFPYAAKRFSSFEQLLQILRQNNCIATLRLAFEVLTKTLGEHNNPETFEQHKLDILRIATITQAYSQHFNAGLLNNSIKLHHFFLSHPDFGKLAAHLKDHEQENSFDFSRHFEFEATSNIRDAQEYSQILAKTHIESNSAREFRRYEAEIEPGFSETTLFEKVSENLKIKPDTPQADFLRTRLRYVTFAQKESKEAMLEIVLRATIMNAFFVPVSFSKQHTTSTEFQELFPVPFLSTPELFLFMKGLLNLFFLPLEPQTHLLVLTTITTLLMKVQIKQPRVFMASVFSYKEIFQKMLKDCSSLRVLPTGEVSVLSVTLGSKTACYSSFLESLLTLIKSRIKQFFTTEESHINIYALSSLIASFSVILAAPIDPVSGRLPFTFKTLRIIVDVFKELIPHQEIIRDFSLVDILKARIEADLEFIASCNKTHPHSVHVFKDCQWHSVSLDKIFGFNSRIVKTIDSAFQPSENLNHHHGMSALARKILDSPFLGLLTSVLGIVKSRKCNFLALETLVLLGGLVQEAPNLLAKLLTGDICIRLIDELVFASKVWNEEGEMAGEKKKAAEENQKLVKLFPGLMNFVYGICMSNKGVEVEKKYGLFPMVLRFAVCSRFTESLAIEISTTKNNMMALLAMEANKFIGNQPTYREIAYLVLNDSISLLLKRQEAFLKEVSVFLSGNNSNIVTEDDSFDYEAIVKSLNNFSEFLSRFLTVRFIEKWGKPLICPFIKLASFPLLSLLDSDAHSKTITCLRHFAFNCKETKNISLANSMNSLFGELSSELDKLEKRLGGDMDKINDLNAVINDDMAYLARNNGLRAILTQKAEGLKYIESLELLGNITYIENLLEFLLYSQSIKAKQDIISIYRSTSKLYRLIVNQLNREDRFFLLKLFEDPEAISDPEKMTNKVLEVIKTANVANRLHFHENLKTFLTNCAANKEIQGPIKQILAESLAKLLISLPKEFKIQDQKILVLELSQSLNILTHFNEIIKDLMQFSLSFPGDLTVKMFEEGVFSAFFRFLTALFVVFSKSSSLKPEDSVFPIIQEILQLILSLCGKILRVFVFVPNDLDCELVINEKSLKSTALKPFLNFIQLEILNVFVISLKQFPILSQTPISKALKKPLLHFLEISFIKLRSSSGLKHQETASKPPTSQNKARKRPMYAYNYGAEEGFDSPEWQSLSQDVIRDLGNMGFSQELSELAISNLEYPSIEAATEWILSHPEDMRRIEEERILNLTKEEEEKRKLAQGVITSDKKNTTSSSHVSNLTGLLGKKMMNELSENEYNEESLLVMFSLAKYFLKVVKVDTFSRSVFEFAVSVASAQTPELSKVILFEIYRLLSEELKELVVSGLINTKIALKLGMKKVLGKHLALANEKEFSGLFAKEYFDLGAQNPDFEDRLRRIDITLGLLIKASSWVQREDFDARGKLFRHKNTIELLRVIERIFESFLAQNNEITESISTVLEALTMKVLVFGNEGFNGSVVECKNEVAKALMVQVMALLSISGQFAKKLKRGLFGKESVQGYLSLLLQTLRMNNGVNVRYFVEKKGVIELLKLENYRSEGKGAIDGCILALFSSILETILVDQDTLDAHYECEIKRFFLEKGFFSNHVRIPLNDFLERFKEYYQKEDFLRVMRKVCVVSQKKPLKEENPCPEKPKEQPSKAISLEQLENKPKIPQNIITLLENIHLKNEPSQKPLDSKPKEEGFSISLKQNVSATVFFSENTKSGMEIEIAAQDSPKTIEYSLKGHALQTLQNLMESILIQFSQFLENKKLTTLLMFPILLKSLQVLMRKFPILIPGIARFNCSKVVRKQGNGCEALLARLELQSRKKKELSVSFLKFLVKAMCFYAGEKFHGLLLEISLDNYLVYEQKNREICGFSSVMKQKVLKTIYLLLKQQVDNPLFLKSQESVNTTFCYASLHVFLMKHQDFCRFSLRAEDPIAPNFLKLYGDAFRQVSINAYQNNALVLLQTPLSILYQLYLSPLTRNNNLKMDTLKALLDSKSQLVPSGTLQSESGFFDDWKILYHSERPADSLDMNPLRFTVPRPVENLAPMEVNQNINQDDSDEEPNEEDRGMYLFARGGIEEEGGNEVQLGEEDQEVGLPLDEPARVGNNNNITNEEEEEGDFEDVPDMDEEEEDDEEQEEGESEQEGESEDNGAHTEEIIMEPSLENQNEELQPAGQMEIEQESLEDSDSRQSVGEEEEMAEIKNKNLGVSRTNVKSTSLINNRNLNLQGVQTILGYDAVFLDNELSRKYQSLVKGFQRALDEQNREILGNIAEISTVNYSTIGTFFTEWQNSLQKCQLKSESSLSPLLKREAYGRLADIYAMEDRVLMLERMLPGMEESEELGSSRNPLRLLNMLINDREERYRNYFQDMRSHLDVLRNVVNHGGSGNISNAWEIDRRGNNLAGLESQPPLRNVAIDNSEVAERRENVVNVAEVVSGFRERIMQGFGESIEIVEEEEKKEEEKVNVEEVAGKKNEIIEENQQKIIVEEQKTESQENATNIVENAAFDNKVIVETKEEAKNLENEENPLQPQEKSLENQIQQENPLVSQEKSFANQEKKALENQEKAIANEEKALENLEKARANEEKALENQEQALEEVKNQDLAPKIEEENPEPKPQINFEDLGLPANFLAINNIDQNYFNSLSEELQMEIILQNLPKDNSSNENASNPLPPPPPIQNQPVEEAKVPENNPNSSLLNPDMLAFLQELPENLRNEVLEQELASMNQRNNPPAQPEIDNATFLASLLPELREEVLLTASPEFLETLPPEIIAEAQQLRDRVNFRNVGRYWREPGNAIPRGKKDKKPAASQDKPVRLVSAGIKDKSVLNRINSMDERIIENLLGFLYCEQSVFQKMSIGLLQTLMRSPLIEYKVFDALLFVLQCERLPKMKEKIIAEGKSIDQFPYLELETKNGVVKKYDTVYQEVSLRSLYLLMKFTGKASLQFFLEKDEKKGLENLCVLREKRGLLSNDDKSRNSNLNELLTLASSCVFQRSFAHLDLYITILYTITEKIRGLGKDVELKIEPESIGDLCSVLRVEFLDDNIMKKLSHIISVLCLEKRNLDCFIDQLKLIILTISERMNEKFEKNLVLLGENKSLEEALVMSQVEGGLEGEKKIYKIFKIIKELFEKALSLEKSKESPEKEKKEAATEQSVIGSETKRIAVRESFQTLIMNESLNNLWINVTEMLMIMNEKYPKSVNFLNPIMHKLISILEGFFIIYSIMRDDYALNKQVDQMKKMPNISHFEAEDEYALILEKTISNLRNSKITIDEMFVLLCERNKKILNMMIRQNPGLLSESMEVVVAKMPKILEFDIKKTYFRRELKRLKGERDRYAPPIRLRIRRDNLFNDSYNQLKNYPGNDIRRKITIEFVGEEGIDQGGLTREWFSLISREMFNENYALFVRSLNGVTFQPDPRSKVNPDHLQYFRFAGRVIGKALYDGYMADAYFTRAFYKHMLGKPLNIYDMEDIDPQYFKNLKWILENDIKDVGDLTFSFERDNFGKIEVHDLIENGRNIPVTNENKKDYVDKICYAKMAQDIKEQIQNFLQGFNELIPTQLISIFDSMELELMISGLPDIDIQDLKENTEYKQYSKDTQVIKWLWEILETLDKPDKAGFIQFVTGTSKVPIEGFKALRGMSGPTRFSINKTYDNTKLPTSHTCFNQLDLPEYPSKEILRDKLLLTIREGKEGFGFL